MSVCRVGMYYFLQSLGMEIIQFVLNGNKTFIALTFHTPNETFEHKVRCRLHCASRKTQTIIKKKIRKMLTNLLGKNVKRFLPSLFAVQWMLDWESFEKDVCSPRLRADTMAKCHLHLYLNYRTF